ncbi:class I SAM-dependent methyltransferase [Roseobacter sp. HKCCD5988]|uniref:class I SAM-dependent methyltransferase n=1 Tax=Roseobacter sp. HKCCD5988 TaxID=3120338 RepID=UPI0030ECFCFA
MINESDKYWQDFYKKNSYIPTGPSAFSQYVLRDIRERIPNWKGCSLLDVGCGNGRDSTYFAQNELNVTAIDRNIQVQNPIFQFYKASAEKFDFKGFDNIYCRFVFHAMTEQAFDEFLEQLYYSAPTAVIYGETRGTEGVTDQDKSATNFQSSIGEKHFRMLYSRDYLENKIKRMFNIIELKSGRNFAIHGDDNPVCHRIIFSRKQADV